MRALSAVSTAVLRVCSSSLSGGRGSTAGVASTWRASSLLVNSVAASENSQDCDLFETQAPQKWHAALGCVTVEVIRNLGHRLGLLNLSFAIQRFLVF